MPADPLQITRGTPGQWAASSKVLLDGQFGAARYPDGTVELKVGNGADEWDDLEGIRADGEALADFFGGSAAGLVPTVNNKVAKGELVFNAKDYGATGDGSTDDTADLQACANAAAAANGIMYIPPGTYEFTELDFSGNSWNIHGAGRDATILKCVGTSGTAITHDGAANYTRRVWRDFTVDTRAAAAGTIGLDLDNVGRSHYYNVRFRCTTVGGGTCVRLTGITDGEAVAHSTYYNDFFSCEFNAATQMLEFIGSTNRNRWFGGVFDGAGTFLKVEQGGGGSNVGTNMFYGVCVATSSTNLLTLGMAAGSTTNVTNWQFINCIFESEAAPGTAVVTFHPNAWRNVFLGGSIGSDVTVVDNGVVNTLMMPPYYQRIGGTGKEAISVPATSSNTGITFGGDANLYRSAADILTTDDRLRVASIFEVGQALSSGTQISANSINSIGSNTNVTMNLNAKGTGRVDIDVSGSATGGVRISKSGGAVGFMGTTPIAKQTLAAAATDAATTMALVNDIRTKLIATGLFG